MIVGAFWGPILMLAEAIPLWWPLGILVMLVILLPWSCLKPRKS
jgi:hypothetical protein